MDSHEIVMNVDNLEMQVVFLMGTSFIAGALMATFIFLILDFIGYLRISKKTG